MVKIQVILGSTRPGRKGDVVFEWVKKNIPADPEASFEFVDLRDWSLPFFDNPESPSRLDKKYTDPFVQKWSDMIAGGDGYIFVVPEYNHGYSAVLKNALDHLYPEWNNKPAAFVSYGGSANGARAVEQLRQVILELRMVPVHDEVNISLRDGLDDQGNTRNPLMLAKLTNLFSETLLKARQQQSLRG